MLGMILEVNSSPSGDELDGDHLLGATVLQLVDVSDFNVEGGQVLINGNVYEYVAIDPETNQMTILAPGLLVDELESEAVEVSPSVIEKWAMVEIQEDDDVILALVPHSLYDRLDDGVREPEDQEAVVVELREGDWIVADVIGLSPSVSGAYIAPGTVPELGDLAAQVQNNTESTANNEANIENVAETAFQALDTATTADGKVTMSDYEPSPEDAASRLEGSAWFVRTRARYNYCTNPSFEVNTADWSSTEAAIARVTAPSAIDGTTVLEVTNSGVAAAHYVTWSSAGHEVEPGQTWTASIFAKLISAVGTGNGMIVTFGFYDAAFVPIGSFAGTPVDLVQDDWIRASVTAQAPDGSAWLLISIGWLAGAGVESSVWQIDGMLIEADDKLGRYFDGSSYDADWEGAQDNSVSVMEGGKIIRVFELDDGSWFEKQFMGDTLQDIDASEITFGYMDGSRIQDYSIPQDKLSAQEVLCSEAVAPGDLVNIYNDGGSAVARLADATTGLGAHGFVLESAAIGETVKVYSDGYNPFLTGMVPGPVYLSTSGGVQSFPPITVGSYQQRVGIAVHPTVLNFTYSNPIRIM